MGVIKARTIDRNDNPLIKNNLTQLTPHHEIYKWTEPTSNVLVHETSVYSLAERAIITALKEKYLAKKIKHSELLSCHLLSKHLSGRDPLNQ
jgi:hypothetical protein